MKLDDLPALDGTGPAARARLEAMHAAIDRCRVALDRVTHTLGIDNVRAVE